MNRVIPWEDIGNPNVDYNVRRVAGTEGVPIYWGKDSAGQCLLIVELTGDHDSQFRRDSTSLYGITVDLRNSDEAQRQRLVLSLARHVDRDLFLGLCETLIASLAMVTDSEVALAVSLAHLKRWKVFLAGRKAKRLSEDEVRGLFAELYVLRRLYQRALSPAAAVDAWCGPDASHQDFNYGNTAVEVKSLSGRERNTVRISSEDQLEGSTEKLFLITIRLSDLPEAERALSLNEIVRLIEGELNISEALEQFSAKIVACGYLPVTDYDQPRFIVSGTQSYWVKRGFPRLIRSELPDGLARVSYEIRLEAIAPFGCDDSEIFGRY